MADRVPCQVCQRPLIPLRDGTHRNHGHHGRCQGSGYRAERWPVGQQLRHHSGGIWKVVEDRGGRWGDYLLRCLHGTPWDQPTGEMMVTHGEYMHRHGWTAIDA